MNREVSLELPILEWDFQVNKPAPHSNFILFCRSDTDSLVSQGDAAPSISENVSPSETQPASLRSNSPVKQAMIASQHGDITNEMMLARYPESPSFDWTRLPMSAALPRHIQFARSIDWASTPLGPIEDWTFDLRAMCNLIMGSPHPAAMYCKYETLKGQCLIPESRSSREWLLRNNPKTSIFLTCSRYFYLLPRKVC